MVLIREYNGNSQSMNVYIVDGEIEFEFDVSSSKLLTNDEYKDLLVLIEDRINERLHNADFNYLDECININGELKSKLYISVDGKLGNRPSLSINGKLGNKMYVSMEEDNVILKLEDNNSSEILILDLENEIQLYSNLLKRYE